jgi:hypothetical protein
VWDGVVGGAGWLGVRWCGVVRSGSVVFGLPLALEERETFRVEFLPVNNLTIRVHVYHVTDYDFGL